MYAFAHNASCRSQTLVTRLGPNIPNPRWKHKELSSRGMRSGWPTRSNLRCCKTWIRRPYDTAFFLLQPPCALMQPPYDSAFFAVRPPPLFTAHKVIGKGRTH